MASPHARASPLSLEASVRSTGSRPTTQPARKQRDCCAWSLAGGLAGALRAVDHALLFWPPTGAKGRRRETANERATARQLHLAPTGPPGRHLTRWHRGPAFGHHHQLCPAVPLERLERGAHGVPPIVRSLALPGRSRLARLRKAERGGGGRSSSSGLARPALALRSGRASFSLTRCYRPAATQCGRETLPPPLPQMLTLTGSPLLLPPQATQLCSTPPPEPGREVPRTGRGPALLRHAGPLQAAHGWRAGGCLIGRLTSTKHCTREGPPLASLARKVSLPRDRSTGHVDVAQPATWWRELARLRSLREAQCCSG